MRQGLVFKIEVTEVNTDEDGNEDDDALFFSVCYISIPPGSLHSSFAFL